MAETIVLTLDTTLPIIYSRGFTVRGTKGMYCEDGNYIHMDGENEFDTLTNKLNNADNYYENMSIRSGKSTKKIPLADMTASTGWFTARLSRVLQRISLPRLTPMIPRHG
jgi:hypothetical protein